MESLKENLENINTSPDCKYRWVHETNLYRNPVFLFLVWKIFFFIWLGLAIFVLAISVPGNNSLATFMSMLYVLLFLLALSAFSYYIYALIMGGKYSVLFEMNKKGVSHTQLPKQFNKAKKIGALAAMASIASGNPSVAGAQLLASTQQSMYTDFKKVRSMKINKRKHIIKLRSSDMTFNQLYTAPEDFDFVLGFIKEHISLINK